MEGVIVNFRGSRRTKHNTQMIISVESVKTREAALKLEGKQAVWLSPAGKEIKGKITKAHGNSGAFRVKFEKGMPGQSISTKVRIS